MVFVVYTDQKMFIGLFNKDFEILNSRMQQLLLATAEYDFEIRYLPGVKKKLLTMSLGKFTAQKK